MGCLLLKPGTPGWLMRSLHVLKLQRQADVFPDYCNCGMNNAACHFFQPADQGPANPAAGDNSMNDSLFMCWE